MRIQYFDGNRLMDAEVPQPEPGEGEVLVRVRAAGVTPTEIDWYPTWNTKGGEKRERPVPAHEFSGFLDGTGEEVFGMNDWFAEGALAEYVVTRPEWIAPKPVRLTHEEAASAPISVLTAWQGLFEKAGLSAGERVLVHGGAGAVGSYAIQLARWKVARVLTTVSPRNFEIARELGAHETIDYRARHFEDAVGREGVDVVFDAVGGETRDRSWAVLRPGGRLVTVAADVEKPGTDERSKAAFFIVEPRRAELETVSRMFDTGQLRPLVDAVAEWDQATAAYQGQLLKRGRGKSVVRVP